MGGKFSVRYLVPDALNRLFRVEPGPESNLINILYLRETVFLYPGPRQAYFIKILHLKRMARAEHIRGNILVYVGPQSHHGELPYPAELVYGEHTRL